LGEIFPNFHQKKALTQDDETPEERPEAGSDEKDLFSGKPTGKKYFKFLVHRNNGYLSLKREILSRVT